MASTRWAYDTFVDRAARALAIESAMGSGASSSARPASIPRWGTSPSFVMAARSRATHRRKFSVLRRLAEPGAQVASSHPALRASAEYRDRAASATRARRRPRRSL